MSQCFAVAFLAILVSACATPPRKPLVTRERAKITQIAVYAQTDAQGIGVRYSQTNTAAIGMQLGFVGGLASALIDEAINDAPMKVATTSADKLNSEFDLARVQHELQSQLGIQLATNALFGIPPTVTAVNSKQIIDSEVITQYPALTFKIEYFLEKDLRSLIVAGTAHLFSAKDLRKDRTRGTRKQEIVYRSRLEYHSDRLEPAPTKTQIQIDAEIAAIKAKYPRASSDDTQFLHRKKQIEQARQQPPAAVQAAHHLEQWLANDAANLKSAMSLGIKTVVKLLSQDITDSTIFNPSEKRYPSDGTNSSASREIVRYPSGVFSGALSSQPKGRKVLLYSGVHYSTKLSEDKATGP